MKLTPAIIALILAQPERSGADLAREYGVTRSAIWMVRQGLRQGRTKHDKKDGPIS